MDFRHSATMQFRTLAALCEKGITTVEENRVSFLSQRMSSMQLSSPASLSIEAKNLVDKFNKYMGAIAASTAQIAVMFTTLIASSIQIALPTYAFWIMRPGTSYFEYITNRYPKARNMSSVNVSTDSTAQLS